MLIKTNNNHASAFSLITAIKYLLKQDSVGPFVQQYGSRPFPVIEQPIQTIILK